VGDRLILVLHMTDLFYLEKESLNLIEYGMAKARLARLGAVTKVVDNFGT